MNVKNKIKTIVTKINNKIHHLKEDRPYVCNITGRKFGLADYEKDREGAIRFGYNSRFRAICYILSNALFGKVGIMKTIPRNKKIRGIGMSDTEWSKIISRKLDYVNTFYHKKPYLDIYNEKSIHNYKNLDFIVSSDVFEHLSPYPGIQIAFNNLYKMLRDGGSLIFSVPYILGGEHIEHYPNLYNYNIIKKDNEYILENLTRDNKVEIFKKLRFHGGKGATLEMRMFSQKSVQEHLSKAGFTNIIFHDITKDMNRYGIFWSLDNKNKSSLIISAEK